MCLTGSLIAWQLRALSALSGAGRRAEKASPAQRSAMMDLKMMFFWISLVPSPMVSTRASS